MTAPTHQLTLVADERRYDLVVPVGTRVTDVLSVLGISSSAAPSSVATASGQVYGPHDRLGDDLPAGSVLTVVRTTTHALHRGVVEHRPLLGGPRFPHPGRGTVPGLAGGGRAVVAESEGPALVDDSTRRRDDLDPEATVSRDALRGPRTAPEPRPARSRRAPEVVPALVVGLGLLCVVVAALARAAAPSANRQLVTAPAARWVAAGLPSRARRRHRRRAPRPRGRPGCCAWPEPRPSRSPPGSRCRSRRRPERGSRGGARSGPRRGRAGPRVARRRRHRPRRAHRDGLPRRGRRGAGGRGAARLVARGVGGPAPPGWDRSWCAPCRARAWSSTSPSWSTPTACRARSGRCASGRRADADGWPPPTWDNGWRRRATWCRSGRPTSPWPRPAADGWSPSPLPSPTSALVPRALPAVAALALGYQARSVRDRVARYAMLQRRGCARHGLAFAVLAEHRRGCPAPGASPWLPRRRPSSARWH